MANKPRTDNVLDTGMSSAVSRKLEDKRQDEAKKRALVRERVSPAGGIILDWIDTERAKVMEDLAHLTIGLDTSEENVKAEILSVQKHLTWLETIKNKAQNLLRTLPATDDQVDEAEAWLAALKAEDKENQS